MISNQKRHVLVYHRADADGFSSLVIAMNGIAHGSLENEFILVPYNYEDKLITTTGENLLNILDEEDKVYFLDCSYTKDKETVEKIIYTVGYENFVIIDHHASMFEWYKENFPSVDLSLSENSSGDEFRFGHPVSAAILVFAHFFPEHTIPKSLELISDYDIFRKNDNWETEVLPFQYCLRTLDFNYAKPTIEDFEEFWKFIYDDKNFSKYISYGSILLKNQKMESIRLIQSYSHEFILHIDDKIYKCLAAPGHLKNSLVFEYGCDPEKYKTYDLFILEKLDPITLNNFISIISNRDDIWASEICKKYGGGGHKGIGGCVVQYHILETNDDKIHLTFDPKL